MIGYSLFISLVGGIDKNELFDAVHPEIDRYRRSMFPNTASSEAYVTLMKRAFLSTGARESEFQMERDWQGRIADMKKQKADSDEYRADVQYGHWFYFFSVFGELAEMDPHYGDRISERLFQKSFYDQFEHDMRRHNVKRPLHLPSLEKVRLGPLRVSLGHELGLETLVLPEFDRDDLLQDGRPAILAALHWRSRLSDRLGRNTEFQRLLDWADNPNEERIQVMLISGPGGVGKSRLAADAVHELKVKHGWSGGIVPAADLLNGAEYDGCGKGIALIIDYPEEYTDSVVEILKSASKPTKFQKPVRIILVSREEKERWKKILNETELPSIDEIRMGFSPFLRKEDAISTAKKVADNYAELIGRRRQAFKGVEDWLDRAHSHRTPLSVLAASVHAVLDPDNAFALTDNEILLSLADIELKRVRQYSLRNFHDGRVLERLLALSLLTPAGLDQNTIHKLGLVGISNKNSATDLLDAVKSTPFWFTGKAGTPGHLERMTPDRPAAALLFRAFDLDEGEYHPELPKWMALVVDLAGARFIDTLSRVSLDLGLLGDNASSAVEFCAVKMLDKLPNTPWSLVKAATQSSDVCATRFTLAICERSLTTRLQNHERLQVFVATIEKLSTLAEYDRAIEIGGSALRLLNKAYDPEDTAYFKFGALIFQRLARAQIHLRKRDEANESSFLALALSRNLMERDRAYLSDYASALRTHSSTLAAIGEGHKALACIHECIHISRQAHSEVSASAAIRLGRALVDQSTLLSEIKRFEEARDSAAEAVEIFSKLEKRYPDSFTEELGTALMNKAGWHAHLGEATEALQAAREAARVKQRCFDARPDVYKQDMAITQNNIAMMLGEMELYTDAINYSKGATLLFWELWHVNPETYSLSLAASLNTEAVCSMKLGAGEDAYYISRRAVQFIDFQEGTLSATEIQWIKNILTVYFLLCKATGRSPDEELLRPLRSALFFDDIFNPHLR